MSIAQLVRDGRRVTVLAMLAATAKPAAIGWVALFTVVAGVRRLRVTARLRARHWHPAAGAPLFQSHHDVRPGPYAPGGIHGLNPITATVATRPRVRRGAGDVSGALVPNRNSPLD